MYCTGWMTASSGQRQRLSSFDSTHVPRRNETRRSIIPVVLTVVRLEPLVIQPSFQVNSPYYLITILRPEITGYSLELPRVVSNGDLHITCPSLAFNKFINQLMEEPSLFTRTLNTDVGLYSFDKEGWVVSARFLEGLNGDASLVVAEIKRLI